MEANVHFLCHNDCGIVFCTYTWGGPFSNNHFKLQRNVNVSQSFEILHLLVQVKAGQMQTQHSEKMWSGGTPQTAGANIRVRAETNADNRAR